MYNVIHLHLCYVECVKMIVYNVSLCTVHVYNINVNVVMLFYNTIIIFILTVFDISYCTNDICYTPVQTLCLFYNSISSFTYNVIFHVICYQCAVFIYVLHYILNNL